MAVKVLEWNQAKVTSKVVADVELRMDRAVTFLRDETKRAVNIGNPTGKEPSAPGEPPRKVTAQLFQSISKAVVKTPHAIIGAYGSPKEYALRLELGFVGIDSLGREYNQAPRPYLRPTLDKNRARVGRFFA